MLERNILALDLPKVIFHSLRHSSITYKLILTKISGQYKVIPDTLRLK